MGRGQPAEAEEGRKQFSRSLRQGHSPTTPGREPRKPMLTADLGDCEKTGQGRGR